MKRRVPFFENHEVLLMQFFRLTDKPNSYPDGLYLWLSNSLRTRDQIAIWWNRYLQKDGTYMSWRRDNWENICKSDRKTGQRSMLDQILASSCFEEELAIKENTNLYLIWMVYPDNLSVKGKHYYISQPGCQVHMSPLAHVYIIVSAQHCVSAKHRVGMFWDAILL